MDSHARYDHYWRVLSDSTKSQRRLIFEMTQASYSAYPGRASRRTLEQGHNRMQRRLPPGYNRCTLEELQQFISDRGLHIGPQPEERAEKRKYLVSILESADEQRTFHRFLDLPRELQFYVCEYHLADLPQCLATPTQPPLARTCRSLRSMALPIFYSLKTFRLTYNKSPQSGTERGTIDDHERLIIHNDDRIWLSCLSTKDLASIRTFDVVVDSTKPYRIAVNLDKPTAGSGGIYVFWSSWMGARIPPSNKDATDTMRKLSDWFGDVEVIDGNKRLRMKDVHAIRTTLERRL